MDHKCYCHFATLQKVPLWTNVSAIVKWHQIFPMTGVLQKWFCQFWNLSIFFFLFFSSFLLGCNWFYIWSTWMIFQGWRMTKMKLCVWKKSCSGFCLSWFRLRFVWCLVSKLVKLNIKKDNHCWWRKLSLDFPKSNVCKWISKLQEITNCKQSLMLGEKS